MGRSFVGVVVGIFVAVVLIAGAGGAFVWWKLSTLKETLLSDLGKALGAQVQVVSLDLDLWKGELHAAGITLVNQRSSAPWEKGDISQATVKFELSDVFSSTLPVTVEVSSWNVLLHSPLRTAEAPPSAAPSDLTGPPEKSRIQVTAITAQEGSVDMDFSDDRKVALRGVAFQGSNNGAGVWTTEMQATSFTAGSFTAGATSVDIRGEQEKITFSNLRLQCDPGGVTGDGEIETGGDHAARLSLKAVDVPVSMLVAIQWQMKLAGQADGDLVYEGDDQGGSAKGQISVDHGKFNLLPWLGKVTAMVGLGDISDVELDKATTDFEWKDGVLHLTNLDVRKNNVTRIGGMVDIDANGQVDGRLKLGLPSSVTSKWPQLQDKIFTVQQDDYNWADVHVTGTSDHLQEDLTARLLTVSVGQGTDLINQGMQKATDLFNSLLAAPATPASSTPATPTTPPSNPATPSPAPVAPAPH
jgi:hypothetical protein